MKKIYLTDYKLPKWIELVNEIIEEKSKGASDDINKK